MWVCSTMHLSAHECAHVRGREGEDVAVRTYVCVSVSADPTNPPLPRNTKTSPPSPQPQPPTPKTPRPPPRPNFNSPPSIRPQEEHTLRVGVAEKRSFAYF